MPSWKRVIVSGSNATLNTLNVTTAFTASGLHYPTADNGEESFLQTNGSGTLSFQYVKTVYEEIYNGEATTITKGTPVYVSGSVGAAAKVFRADASNASKMPVTYIAADTLAAGATGRGIVLGLIKGVDTTGYPPGTEIYVAAGGGWTSTRPTGTNIVQLLGIVTKEGPGGQGIVLNPGPNSLPNLPSGSVWVGDSNSTPVAVPTSSLNVASASFATTASFTTSASFVPNTFLQNGNSFGAQALLGTNDNQNLALETSGSIRMFISSSGNIGINTTSPSARLDVNGNMIVGAGNKSIGAWPFYISDSSNLGWKVSDSSGTAKFELYVGSSGINQMRLLGGVSIVGFSQNLSLGTSAYLNTVNISNTNGNVGIGTTSPTRGKVEVIQTTDTSSGGLAIVNSAINGSLRLWVDSTGISNIANGTSSNISILSTGNVGIGTTTPTRTLTVKSINASSAVRVEPSAGTNGATQEFTNDGGTWLIGSENVGGTSIGSGLAYSFSIGTTSNRPFSIITNNVNRLSVLGDGNVGIGTTSTTSRLEVVPTANQTPLTLSGYSLTGANTQPAIDISGTWNTTGTPTLIRANVTNTASNASSLLMDLQVGGSSQFRVTRSGHGIISSLGTNINILSGNWYLRSIPSGMSSGTEVGISFTQLINGTGGSARGFESYTSFSPSSGNLTWTSYSTSPSINQTGGANGITRGLYVNPTLTSAASWRSIEWSNNTGWGLYSTSTANNSIGGRTLLGTTTDNGIDRLQVNGSTAINGNTTITGSLAVSQSLLQYSNITSVTSGSTSNVASFNTSSYTAVFFDYVATSGTNARAGTVFTVWNGNNVEYTETSTNDIGNTNNLVLSASLSAGAIRLQATSLSGSWSVKTLARMI